MAHDRVKAEQVEALDQALRNLFQNLEAQAPPDSLRPGSPTNLFDQLFGVPPAVTDQAA